MRKDDADGDYRRLGTGCACTMINGIFEYLARNSTSWKRYNIFDVKNYIHVQLDLYASKKHLARELE